MNAPIFRLYAFFLVLFAVLIAFTSRWAVFGATALRENPKNKRVVLEEQRIKRGVIRARDGEVLAGSVRLSGDRYGRRYPTGRAVRARGRLRLGAVRPRGLRAPLQRRADGPQGGVGRTSWTR